MNINTEINRIMNTAIDSARERADRLYFEEMEKRQNEYELMEESVIDERIDEMTISDMYDAIQKDDGWLIAAQNAAQSTAKDSHCLALGKILARMIRENAKKLVEQENV